MSDTRLNDEEGEAPSAAVLVGAGGSVARHGTSLGEVIVHIVATHHAALRIQLPRLRDLIDDVVAGASPQTAQELSELHPLYSRLLAEVGGNLSHEEQLVFPAILRIQHRTTIPACQAGMVASRVRLATAEHRRISDLLAKMRELSARHLSPSGPCETCHALQGMLSEIEAGMREHDRLEREGVFGPAVELEARLGAGDARGVSR